MNPCSEYSEFRPRPAMVPKIGILVAKPFVFHAGDRCVRKLFALLEDNLEGWLTAKIERTRIGSGAGFWRGALRSGIAERDGRTENAFSLRRFDRLRPWRPVWPGERPAAAAADADVRPHHPYFRRRRRFR